jgi:DNA-binding transcriptional LysR family regulator
MKQRDIRSLDIGMLRTFEALMHERSVSRAAARLFLSQPAVSASLNRLRDTFNDPLFTRTAHGVVPTGRAQALAAPIGRVLADLSALLDSEQAFDPASSVRIFRIAGSDHRSKLLLPELGRILSACSSRMRIVWSPPSSTPLAEQLRRGDLDLAVVARVQRPESGVAYQLLYEDRHIYAMRADHPAAGQPVTLDSFCAVPQIFLGYGTSTLDDLIDETLARTKRHRNTQFAVSGFDQIIHHLLNSDHAAVIPWRVASAFQDRLRIQELPFELPRYQLLMCWSPGAEGDPGGVWLRRHIAEIISHETSTVPQAPAVVEVGGVAPSA